MALLCAIFFALAPATARAQAGDEIDIAVDAFAAAGTLAGVSIGETEKSLIKAAAGCVANNRSFLDCARDEIVKRLPKEVRPMAQCLVEDIGNIDKNIGKCALQAAAPQLEKQLPPEVFKCLSDNLNDMGKCALDSAVSAATQKALSSLPPEARQLAECVAKVQTLPSCANLGGLKDLGPVKDALAAAEKLKEASGTVSNIIKVAEGIKKDDWAQVLAYGGVEAYKAAVKIVLNVLLTPALAPLIGPIVDAVVDSRVELVTDLIKALKQKDHARIVQIAGEFYLAEQIRSLCAIIPAGDVHEATCGNMIKAIGELGNIAYGIVNCETLKKGNVVGDAYQLACGVAGDAADLAFEAGDKLVTGISDTGEFFGKLGGEAVKGVGKAFDAIKDCEFGGVVKDGCNTVKEAVETAGNVAEAVFKAPGSIIDGIGSLFGGSPPKKMTDTDCQRYAQRAVQQANENRQKGCQQQGNAWGTDYNGHYNWCRGVRVSTANGEIKARDGALNRCLECGNHMRRTNDQIKQATQNGCIGDLGAGNPYRWGTGRGHYDWCMTVKKSTSDGELRARDEGLNKCNFCNDYRRKTEDQVNSAKQHGCIDDLRGRSADNRNRWGDNFDGHFQFCMREDPGFLNRELGARAGELNHCAFCTGYQKATDNQIQQAKNMGCIDQMRAINANRWGDGLGHLHWCMSGSATGPTRELGSRAGDLGRCRPPAGPPQPGITIICPDGRPAPPGQACPPPPRMAPTHVRCPDGSWAHPNQPCPPMPAQARVKTCPGGQVVPINATCPNPTKTCPGGQVVLVTAQCPPTTKTCPGGQVVAINAQCPATTKKCPGGQVVPINATCPNPMKTCPGGQVVLVTAQCPPTTKTCPGGQVVAINAQCPATTKKCPGGQVVAINAQCPATTKTCPGGSVLPINATCPNQTKRCPNGQVVPITAACPAPPPPQNCRMEPDVSACPLASPGSKPCKPPLRRVCGPSSGGTNVR
jgi:hypothetical protein